MPINQQVSDVTILLFKFKSNKNFCSKSTLVLCESTRLSLKNEYLRVKAFNKFKTSKLVFVPKSIISGRG